MLINMTRKLPQLISLIFHPLFIPVYLLWFIFTYPGLIPVLVPFGYQMILFAIVVLSTVIIPLFMVYLMLRQKLILSVHLHTREERVYPILAMAVFYYLTYYLVKGVSVVSLFGYFMLGATLVAAILLLLNFFLKTSLHMASLGSCSGFLAGYMIITAQNLLLPLILMLLLSGILGYTRLKLETHKPIEIYTGFLAGFFTLISLFILV